MSRIPWPKVNTGHPGQKLVRPSISQIDFDGKHFDGNVHALRVRKHRRSWSCRSVCGHSVQPPLSVMLLRCGGCSAVRPGSGARLFLYIRWNNSRVRNRAVGSFVVRVCAITSRQVFGSCRRKQERNTTPEWGHLNIFLFLPAHRDRVETDVFVVDVKRTQARQCTLENV